MTRLRRVLTRHGSRRSEGAGVPARDWRATLKRRLMIAAAVFGFWVVGIEARLVYLQVVDHADLVDRAERQQMRTIKPAAKRGDILDRRGRVLATSVDTDSIYAVPSAIDDVVRTARRLCAALGDCSAKDREDLADRLRRQRNFAYVRRQIMPDVARRIAALNLDGIGFVKESRRFYPNKELAAHLLGFVGVDNKGLAGIESAYDSQIRGKDGQILVQTDARRQAFNWFERPPTAGATIELTIDQYLQHIAEKELRVGVAENQAEGGSVVIMNPRTGEILAMANEPTFNPNAYRDSVEVDRRNRAVQDLYEPGSTFKVVTASAALEERILPPDALIDASGGQIKVGPRVISDTHDYGVLSFTDVIVKSSNVGAIRIGFRLGPQRLSDYVQRFGFGRPISPDFPSENGGIVWARDKWTDSALASVSMGYQVGVTPLQMAAAVSSVANKGQYVEPRAVRAVYRAGRRYEVTPRVVRQTISVDAAAAMTTMMEQVVERGTAASAQIPGYAIAGKTGTANTLVSGRYTNDTFASFVGFLPSESPVATILVVIDSPHGSNGHFGGPVAGPVFRRIAEATLRYLGVPPTINPAPPILIAKREEAAPIITATRVEAPGPTDRVPPTPSGTVPDVRGLVARDAMRVLVRAGLRVRLSGDGIVASQVPAPGDPIEEGSTGRLTLTRTVAQTAEDRTAP